MTVTSQSLVTHTPIPGQSFPSGNKKRYFVGPWMEAKEVREPKWADWVGENKEGYPSIEIETGQKYAPFIRTTLGAEAGASDEQLTFATTALMRKGDQGIIEELYNGSTTEYDDTWTELFTILSIDSGTLATVQRHEGEVADGSYRVHPSGSRVSIKSRAQNYYEPFPDAITFRGDSITVHPQRFDSGEVPYDLAAVNTGDYEEPGGHYASDIMYWKKELPNQRNFAMIRGRKVTGDYTSSPKIPYRLSGAIWWAEQVGTNVQPINGMLDIFDFSDIFEDLAVNHSDGPGDAIWMSPRLAAIWSEMLLPFKSQFGGSENSISMATNLSTLFGDVSQKGLHWDRDWPNSKILITSKKDWEWGHQQGMPWTYVERDAADLGTFGQSWTMGGDFAQVCKNVSHQRLLTGIETRKGLYPARTQFL